MNKSMALRMVHRFVMRGRLADVNIIYDIRHETRLKG